MNNRERAMNLLHFKSVDRLPAVHFGYWAELLDEWADQGHISRELAKAARGDGSQGQRELDRILGWDFNWHSCRGSSNSLNPAFERKVLETLPDGSQRVQTANGVIEPGLATTASTANRSGGNGAYSHANPDGSILDPVAVISSWAEASGLEEA